MSDKASKMAAIGGYDSVLPFKAIGLDTVVITDENKDDFGMILAKFSNEAYVAVFVEEAVFAQNQEAIKEIDNFTDMCIIPVPNQSGSMGIGLEAIRKTVERAVGMDIFGDK